MPLNEKNEKLSGIDSLGEYKEGFCFRLRLKNNTELNFCADN